MEFEKAKLASNLGSLTAKLTTKRYSQMTPLEINLSLGGKRLKSSKSQRVRVYRSKERFKD